MQQRVVFLAAALTGSAGAVLRLVCSLQAVNAQPVLLRDFEPLLRRERSELFALEQEMCLLAAGALGNIVGYNVRHDGSGFGMFDLGLGGCRLGELKGLYDSRSSVDKLEKFLVLGVLVTIGNGCFPLTERDGVKTLAQSFD